MVQHDTAPSVDPDTAPGDPVGRSSGTPTFDNIFVRDLAGLYERWEAAPVARPELVRLNDEHAADLGLDGDWLRSAEGVGLLTGTQPVGGAEPVAQAYAGHQFGGFSPRLGDGRALLLGEIVAPDGTRHDLHLKGSGRTPFARGGDGRAALGPMLREFLMCEAMHALGVPTTRALAVVTTGEQVVRETVLPGAIFARTASSHLRVGTFQYAATLEDPTAVERLLDHAIARHHPQVADAAEPALAFLGAVMDAQASLVAHWMSIGFVHGVMNTDNVTISGETIDYGPCAFMDAYDEGTVFSSIDHGARYAFGNPPRITQWNLARLAEALLPRIDDDQDVAVASATALLREFDDRHRAAWLERMSAKLGLRSPVGHRPAGDGSGPDDGRVVEEAGSLIDDLVALMAADHVDLTSLFRRLSDAARGDREPVRLLFVDLAGIDAWLDRWTPLVDGAAADRMDSVNPIYVPRNHLVQAALDSAETGDLDAFDRLADVLSDPFTERDGLDEYAEPAPESFGRYRTFCGT